MSMTAIRFEIPGDAVAKGRPRATTIGGKARLYTPAKTERYESRVAVFAQQAMAGRLPLDEALSVRIVATLAIPASWSKRRRQAALAGEVYPVSRPDADNIAKAVTDGANGIAYVDDSRIVSLQVSKVYGAIVGVSVCIEPLVARQTAAQQAGLIAEA
jgi:Holliday junction resolvase RusA-like endonuclease